MSSLPPGGPHVVRVSELTRTIRDALRAEERLRDLWVEGEVGRVTVSSAGHAYFTLKDERAQLSCVMFREERARSTFEPRTGHHVVAHGRIDVFEGSGVYQLYVDTLQPAGFGELALRFEALKARLAAEGLFDSARKRPLPARPTTIAVVTSPTGAVWHDVRTVIARRWPLANVILVPCLVQGEAAPASIVRALERLARHHAVALATGRPEDAPDVTILARGGGSLEDLFSFNDERVVRAVVSHPIPLVCGVGHEVDVTLADLAADVRAPTPSAAAELVVPDGREVSRGLDGLRRGLDERILDQLGSIRRDLAAERRALEGLRPDHRLAAARERAGHLLDRATRVVVAGLLAARRHDERAAERLLPAVTTRLVDASARLAQADAALGALGPAATLARGYAIVRRDRDGTIVRRPADAPAGTALRLDLAEGAIGATSTGEDASGDAGIFPGEPPLEGAGERTTGER